MESAREERIVKGFFVFIKIEETVSSFLFSPFLVSVQGLVVLGVNLLKALEEKEAFFGIYKSLECFTFLYPFLPGSTLFAWEIGLSAMPLMLEKPYGKRKCVYSEVVKCNYFHFLCPLVAFLYAGHSCFEHDLNSHNFCRGNHQLHIQFIACGFLFVSNSK